MRNFENDLPDGYRKIFTIDALDKKTAVLLNLAALLITAVCIAVSVLIIRPRNFFAEYSAARNIIALCVMFAYIVLHELTHGAAYRLLTKQKLKFGISLTFAYCGVPDIYVYRRTAVIALISPLCLFSAVFIIAGVCFINEWDKFYTAVIFAIHLGGCAGDIYDTVLYLFRFRNPRILMRDTGPKQEFFLDE